ncbi:hypothetical protein V6N13_071560 [Hibiscus sabdariffa]
MLYGESEIQRKKGVITLFVSSLPSKLHWTGLRQTFGRHGDLVDAYVASKRDKQGRGFGFVRFSNQRDADRAMERLNGFYLYGFKLRVTEERFKTRTTYWRRKKGTPNQVSQRGNRQEEEVRTTGETERLVKQGPEKAKGAMLGEETEGRKKQIIIQGHVDSESLWKLSRCLVGTMATDVSVETAKDRLHIWGLGSIAVKWMGGRSFLLEVEDEELLKMMESQNWSLLEEVFADVSYWTESFRVMERIIWVEIRGIPLHCWNYETLKRIVAVWGDLVALGENVNQRDDCAKVTVLISTKQIQIIENTVIIQVGNESFSAWVAEIHSLRIKYDDQR